MQAPRIPSSERLSEKCKLKQSQYMWARSHGSPDEEEESNMKKKKKKVCMLWHGQNATENMRLFGLNSP